MASLALDRLVKCLRAAAQAAQRALPAAPPESPPAPPVVAGIPAADLLPPARTRIARLALDLPVTVEEIPGSRALALRVGPPPPRRNPVMLRIEIEGDDLTHIRTSVDGHEI